MLKAPENAGNSVIADVQYFLVAVADAQYAFCQPQMIMLRTLIVSVRSFRILALLAVFPLVPAHLKSADLFSSSKAENKEPSYASIQAIMAATRSGILPQMLTSEDSVTQFRYRKGVGKSMLAILQQQNLFPKESLRHDTADLIGLLFVNISKAEMSGGKDKNAPEAFKNNWKRLGEDCNFPSHPQLRANLENIIRDYSQAVKQVYILQEEGENQRIAANLEKERQANAEAQRMKDASAEREAVANAARASRKAEDEIRADAVRQGMEAQAELKQKKREEILSSSEYKLWKSAVQVEEGLKMVARGRAQLAAQIAIERESSVADLTARRAAGEQVAAGKLLVERAFELYRSLGGEAATPEDVKAGPDPAAAYR